MNSKNICHIITSLLVKYFTIITQYVLNQQIFTLLLVSKRDKTYVVAHTQSHTHGRKGEEETEREGEEEITCWRKFCNKNKE